MSVDVQLYANTVCDTLMHRLSLFESVPDFAAGNGVCSFRNWFHLINTTEGTRPAQGIIKVARLCLVLVCRGRYGLGGGFFSSSWDRVWAE
jgi:hypothetical protein